ncbi:MAG TPA: hypothetical protein DEW46_14490, partial [Verrucomicrobia bacterium]|nr:hypothetical protein [Verrucomicrobiota bacterium]
MSAGPGLFRGGWFRWNTRSGYTVKAREDDVIRILRILGLFQNGGEFDCAGGDSEAFDDDCIRRFLNLDGRGLVADREFEGAGGDRFRPGELDSIVEGTVEFEVPASEPAPAFFVGDAPVLTCEDGSGFVVAAEDDARGSIVIRAGRGYVIEPVIVSG